MSVESRECLCGGSEFQSVCAGQLKAWAASEVSEKEGAKTREPVGLHENWCDEI